MPPEERRVAMVFQNYALWPHLTALDTVAYPLLRAGEPTRSAKAAAHRLLDALGIGALAGRLPSELSGGQQQRVGLARALASNPVLFLFDEPTAHLDAALRFSLQQELAHRREASGAAAVYATHDPAEALAMADRVALLRNGTLAQVGSPVDVYERPVDAWCAQLAGPADVIAARLVSTADHVVTVAVNGVTLTLPGGSTVPPGPVRLVVRPAWAHLGGPLTGVVVRVWYTGGSSDIVIRTAGGRVRIATDRPDRVRPGDEVTWGLHRAWLVGSGEAAP